jgi:integrase/recombinase XerD
MGNSCVPRRVISTHTSVSLAISPTFAPIPLDFFPHQSDIYTCYARNVRSADATMSKRNGNGHRDRNLKGLIDLYLLRSQVEGKSPNTLKAYAWTLKRFAEIAEEESFPQDVARITPAHIYVYLGRFAHLSPESRHRYHREVSCFFNSLQTMGYLEHSPFAHIKKVRLPQKIVQPFSPDEVLRLLACCDPGTPAGARDRAMVLILLDTGIRVGELVKVELSDLDLEAQRLRILYGKGNKQRVVAFGEDCRKALFHYLESYRRYRPGRLFVSMKGKSPLQPNAVKQVLRRLGRQAAVSKVHAHRFRHTFATWAIEQDARELDVQYLLGHSTPDMVRRYSATYNSEKAARAHHLFSPAARLHERLPVAHR